jgi:DnaK suppressor protein
MDKQETPIENTPFNKKEQEYFRKRLLDEKEKAEIRIKNLKESIGDLNEAELDEKSSLDDHQGNIGTDELNKETKYTMIEKEKKKIEKIIVALDRIADGNYGICLATGKPIAKERLEAIPYALYTVEAANEI